MATVAVLNTTANISGKTLVFAERDHTITGAWTFDRDPSAPFIVTAGSALVTNLDADKLDGQDGSYYTTPSNATATATAVQTTTLTGAQNDFVLTVVKIPIVLRCNNATLLTLSGFVAGVDGQRLTIISIGAGQVDLVHQATSAAANQLTNFATVGKTSLAAGSGIAEYEYDLTSTKWRLISHVQGAWIIPTFAAGDYTASAGTWTVGSGDITSFKYLLNGRTLHVAWWIDTTTTSAGMGTDLRITLPGGYTANATIVIPTQTGDNNVAAIGLAITGAGQAYITLRLINSAAWASGITNLTYMRGEITTEVT